MIINEIFNSIDGEGLRAGELATFVRLAGCNMRCSYCDTLYALNENDGKELKIDEVIQKVEQYKTRNITLTGGEPLINKDVDLLIDELIKRGYKVNIETNGSIPIDKYLNRCLITMDCKTPSSLMEKKMLFSNIEKLTENDVLKFVVKESDFNAVEKIIKSYEIKSYIYISPIFGEIEPNKIVEFMKKMNERGVNMEKVRTQVQLHKIIWNPNMKGV